MMSPIGREPNPKPGPPGHFSSPAKRRLSPGETGGVLTRRAGKRRGRFSAACCDSRSRPIPCSAACGAAAAEVLRTGSASLLPVAGRCRHRRFCIWAWRSSPASWRLPPARSFASVSPGKECRDRVWVRAARSSRAVLRVNVLGHGSKCRAMASRGNSECHSRARANPLRGGDSPRGDSGIPLCPPIVSPVRPPLGTWPRARRGWPVGLPWNVPLYGDIIGCRPRSNGGGLALSCGGANASSPSGRMAGASLHAGRAFAASSPGLVFANCLALLLRRRSFAGSLAVLGVLPFRIAGLEFFARLLGIIARLIGHFCFSCVIREPSA